MQILNFILSFIQSNININKLKILDFNRPELTIRLEVKKSTISPIDNIGNLQECKWIINIIITNNSEIKAYYPEIKFSNADSSFVMKNKLEYDEPIGSTDKVILNGECKSQIDRNLDKQKSFPKNLEHFKILLKYKSPAKKKCYTLYDYADKKNPIGKFLIKMPKEF